MSRRRALLVLVLLAPGVLAAVVWVLSNAREPAPTALVTGFSAAPASAAQAPALPPRRFTDAAAATAWQEATRTRLAQRFALAPAGVPLVSARATLPAPAGLVRERLLFTATDGSEIPAIVQYPAAGSGHPGVLVIPGHTPAAASGLQQLVDGDDSYQMAAATRIAQAGMVTLAFELRGFGLLGAPLGTGHNQVAYNALQDGRFYKALVLDDARSALALLASLDVTDSARLAVTGASLGGELAVFLGALDSRIKAVAFSSYGGESGPYPALRGSDADRLHYCHVVPGAWHFLRQEDPVLLLAPRPVIGLRGAQNVHLDDEFSRATGTLWALLGAAHAFAFETVPGRGHEFFVDQTIAFLRGALAVPVATSAH